MNFEKTRDQQHLEGTCSNSEFLITVGGQIKKIEYLIYCGDRQLANARMFTLYIHMQNSIRIEVWRLNDNYENAHSVSSLIWLTSRGCENPVHRSNNRTLKRTAEILDVEWSYCQICQIERNYYDGVKFWIIVKRKLIDQVSHIALLTYTLSYIFLQCFKWRLVHISILKNQLLKL